MTEEQKARIVELARECEAGFRLARGDEGYEEWRSNDGFYEADEASAEAFRIAQQAA